MQQSIIIEQMKVIVGKLESKKFSDGKLFSSEPSVQSYANELKKCLELLENQDEENYAGKTVIQKSSGNKVNRVTGTHDRQRNVTGSEHC